MWLTSLPALNLSQHQDAFQWEGSSHQVVKVLELQQQSFQWISLVQFSHSVMSNSLQPCGPQYTKPPCPSPTPRVYSNSSPLSRWCHPTISCPVVPFSSCPQSFPASRSFQMSQLFTSGSQSLSNEYSRLISRMDWLDLLAVSLKGLSRVFSNTTVQRINSLVLSFLFSPTVTSIQRLLKKS